MPSRLERFLSKHPASLSHSASIAYLAALDHIEAVSPSIASSIVQELKDERSHLKLIASENFSSLAVQLAMGNLLTDKYAEGYPYHRFYAGCGNVDAIEELAAQGANQAFFMRPCLCPTAFRRRRQLSRAMGNSPPPDSTSRHRKIGQKIAR